MLSSLKRTVFIGGCLILSNAVAGGPEVTPVPDGC